MKQYALCAKWQRKINLLSFKESPTFLKESRQRTLPRLVCATIIICTNPKAPTLGELSAKLTERASFKERK